MNFLEMIIVFSASAGKMDCFLLQFPSSLFEDSAKVELFACFVVFKNDICMYNFSVSNQYSAKRHLNFFK